MNISVRFAVVGALALVGEHALAISPAQINTAAGNGTLVTLYVSGSTATDNALENLFKLDAPTYRVCQPGTLDIYYYKSSSGSISQRALACTASFSGTGITSGSTSLVLLKESAGGSANGIIYPAAGTTLSFIDLVGGGSNFAMACAAVTTSTGTTLPSATSTFNARDCGYAPSTSTSAAVASSVTRSNVVPQAGISDIEPASFVGIGGVTSAHNSALTRKRISVAVTFNPIVSVPLFTALQRAYGYVASSATEDTSSLSKVPSLPGSVLTGVFNGSSILTADEIYINGVQLSTMTGGNDENIYICRAGNTSGVMRGFMISFFQQGCSKNAGNTISFVGPDDTSCTNSGCTWSSPYYNHYVFAGLSAGDVRSCVNYQSSQNRLAVGIASTEDKPNTTNKRYRYIKVDGVEPTLKATMEGHYSFFTEITFNDKFSGTSASGSQTLWDKLYASVGNSTVISYLNRAWRSSMALTGTDDGTLDTGILDFATSANATAINMLFSDGAITGSEVRATPVNPQTRQTLGSEANACNEPYMAYP